MSSKKIRVSRGHYGDLEVAALNCGNPKLQQRFEEMKVDPGFEIIDNPRPDDLLQDLSVMFMYPNLIKADEIIKTSLSNYHTCKACQERDKTWNGQDPKCAFKNHVFDSDNWNCATLSKIRKLINKLGLNPIKGVSFTVTETEQKYATINVDGIKNLVPEDQPCPVSLYIGWYKNRGCTECMWLMYETLPPRPPTEEECLTILEAYKKFIEPKLDFEEL